MGQVHMHPMTHLDHRLNLRLIRKGRVTSAASLVIDLLCGCNTRREGSFPTITLWHVIDVRGETGNQCIRHCARDEGLPPTLNTSAADLTLNNLPALDLVWQMG